MEENSTSDEEKPIEENSVNSETNKEISADADSEEVINEEKNSVSDESEISEPELQKDAEVTNNSEPSSEPVSKQTKESEPVQEEPETQIETIQEKEEPVEAPKEETPVVPKSKEGKEGSWMPMIIVMGVSLFIAFAWDKGSFVFIKNSVHAVLNPSAGALLGLDKTIGMLVIVLCIGLLTTFIQKYATDQAALRELKKEQKILQEEMKKYKDHPEKVAELSKKQLQFIPKTFKLTSRGIMFTGVPFILFFRWFTDYFASFPDFKFFGFLSWFWFYLIFTMIFSTILRKALKVV